MDHVEVLMRLHASPDMPMSVREVEVASRLGPETTRKSLQHLAQVGLARHDPAADSYVFAPPSLTDRRAVDALSVMYHQRPVTLVKLIYEQPPAPLKLFADAFRLRENKDEE
jgi:DNA-binding IclR family transcriptional regulator